MSDRWFRTLFRLLTRRALLYTEMLHTGAVLSGDRERVLGFDPNQSPVALQLGGDDPRALAAAARVAEDWGYDEVNLNVGCPSERVQQGRFGAILMREPDHVGEIVASLRAAVRVPVTVKHRLGVDELDHDEHLHHFVGRLVEAGVDRITVHARKAWLSGLSPKENRTIPPLQPERVLALKRAFPKLFVEYNGGVRDLDAAATHLQQLDGVMLGRAAMEDPWLFIGVDPRFYGEPAPNTTREGVIEGALALAERAIAAGGRAQWVTRHLLELYRGQPGARAWKHALGRMSELGPARAFSLGLEQVHAAQARRPPPSPGLSAAG